MKNTGVQTQKDQDAAVRFHRMKNWNKATVFCKTRERTILPVCHKHKTYDKANNVLANLNLGS